MEAGGQPSLQRSPSFQLFSVPCCLCQASGPERLTLSCLGLPSRWQDPGIRGCAAMSGAHIDSGDLNLGGQVCVANSLLAEPPATL